MKPGRGHDALDTEPGVPRVVPCTFSHGGDERIGISLWPQSGVECFSAMPYAPLRLTVAHDAPSVAHRVVALAHDGMAPFEVGIAAEVFGLSRPELDVPWWYRLTIAGGT